MKKTPHETPFKHQVALPPRGPTVVLWQCSHKKTILSSKDTFLFSPSKARRLSSHLAGGSHGHLEQDDLPVLRRVALIYVPGESRRAVERGGAILAGVNLGGVHETQVSLLASPVGEILPAHGAQ
jgi:hypothetical protein